MHGVNYPTELTSRVLEKKDRNTEWLSSCCVYVSFVPSSFRENPTGKR